MIFLIGGHKCGTTFFHQALCKHPSINEGYKKEIEYYNLNYHLGKRWYDKHRRNIDSSTGYMSSPLCPYLIKKDFDNPLIIALVRNPVNRAYSHYIQNVTIGKEKRTFDNAIKEEPYTLTKGSWYYKSYLSRGLYADQLRPWIKLFDPIVIKSEDMFKDPMKYLNLIFDELEFDRIDIDLSDIWKRKGSYKSMSNTTRSKLEEFYKTPNDILEEMVGINWQ